MGVKTSSAFAVCPVGGIGGIADALEHILLTTGFLSQPYDGAPVLICWFVNTQGSASTTSTNIRIRRGSTTSGVAVMVNGFVGDTYTPTVGGWRSGFYVDIAPGQNAMQYSLSIQYVGNAVGTGVNDCAIFAAIL